MTSPRPRRYATSDAITGVSFFPGGRSGDERLVFHKDQGGNELVHVYVREMDGRIVDLLPPAAPLGAALYRLTFDTGAYFAARSRSCFHPRVAVEFMVDDPAAHYHVPLLVSPFGYTTYRGS